MVDLSVTVGRPPIEVILGENTTEARRQALFAQEAADQMTAIANAEGRAALYGVTDPLLAESFGAYGLELDFAASYYRKGHEIGSAPADLTGWTFNRDSVATWQTGAGVTDFATDVARVIANVGLVMEPTTQNIILRSKEFDHAAWDKINAGTGVLPVVVANDAAAPDGTTTADKITLSLGGGTSASDRSHLQQDIATTTSAKYGGSLFVKGVNGEKIVFRHVAGGGYLLHTFNGAWQRLSSVEIAAGTAATFEFGLRGSFGTSNAVVFHAWGAQIEAGDDVTSYVATGEFSGTRDEDTATIDGLRLENCTVYIEATLTSGASTTELGKRVLAALYAGTGTDDIATIVNNDAGGFGAVVEAANVVSGTTTTTTVAAAGEVQKVALRLAPDDIRMFRNGIAGGWLFDADTPNALSKLHVGGSPLSTLARLGGTIRKIVIFPFAMSDSELSAMTGGEAYPAGTINWQRVVKNAAFSTRDSAKTFKLGGYQYIANGFYPTGDNLRHDLWRASDGLEYSLVNADPDYDDFSQVVALDGVIYAWCTKMFKSVDGGTTFTEILATLPWGTSSFDSPAIVHGGKLLFVHGTGDAVTGTDGVWEFDPVGEDWTLIEAAPWGGRDVPILAEFDGDLYLYGGWRNVANVPAETTYPTKTTLNDLWRSTDGGLSWTQIVADMPCQPRAWPVMIEFEGRFYMMGGYDNIGPAGHNYSDTWVSDDGVAWARLYATNDYLERHAPVAYVFNGEMFLVSGNANAQAPGEVLNDIWRLVL